MARLHILLVLLVCLAYGVICKPLEVNSAVEAGYELGAGTLDLEARPRLKRFVNSELALGTFADIGLPKMRTRRSSDACEKLNLCKLHARSNRNFMSAFELYFVNKENAKQWDHSARSLSECEQRFGGGCYGNPEPAPAPRPQHAYQFVDDDYE